MSIKIHQTKVPMILNWILVLACVTAQIKVVQSRKLDETIVPAAATTNGDECTPCGSTSSPPPSIVYPSPPPPPIVYPSPPPPIVYPSPPPPPPTEYSSPPPPSPKKSPSKYCPPPPPSSYMFMAGPPGNLYPVNENFNGASRHNYGSFSAFLTLLVGLLSLLEFW